MGKARKRSDLARKRTIAFRVSEKEWNELHKRASVMRTLLSKFIRSQLFPHEKEYEE